MSGVAGFATIRGEKRIVQRRDAGEEKGNKRQVVIWKNRETLRMAMKSKKKRRVVVVVVVGVKKKKKKK